MKNKWMTLDNYIENRFNKLSELVKEKEKKFLKEDIYNSFKIYVNHRIFNNSILICDSFNNWLNLISKTLHLDKSHIKYEYASNTFVINNFESGIELSLDLLKQFNFKFENGLISNELSIVSEPPLENENFNRTLQFLHCHFKESFSITRININKEILFEYVKFKKEVNIQSVNCDKNSRLEFSNCSFKKECRLKNNIFNSDIKFMDRTRIKELILEENTFNKYFFVQKCFIHSVSLYKNKFEDKCYFVDSSFGDKDSEEKVELNFSNARFTDNIHFNNSHFYDYADFHECEFEKIACFYGVSFYETPNFSQAIFKENLNLVNAELNFNFEKLQEKIKQVYEDFNKDKNEQDKKPLENIANDFRDSFRSFKSVLIKDNNLLDASNFHRIELYCKEIELQESLNRRGIEAKSENDIRKNTNRVRDIIDSLLLGFYRKLSDHHTDFLKIFNNLILLISLYAVFFMGLSKLYEDKLKDSRCKLTLFHFFDTYESWIVYGVYSVLMFGCIWILFKYLSPSKTPKKDIFKFYEAFPILVKDFCKLVKSISIALFFVSFFTFYFLLLYEFFILDKDVVYSIFINVLFISLYLSLVYTKSLFFGRYVLLGISYVWFIVIMIQHPDIIYPLIFNSINKTFNYLPLTTLVIIYTILLGLVLFSLQKTARKNSIVPN